MPDGNNYDFEVDYDELIKELSELADLKKGVSSKNAELRSRLASILEQKGYHKRALATIREIDNMSLTARNDFLRSFEPMFDLMLSKKWRDEQQDLFNDDTSREE